MKAGLLARCWPAAWLLWGCGAPAPARAPEPVAAAVPAPPPLRAPELAASEPAAPAAPPYEPCGALDCRSFATAQAAFASVLANDPVVLAVGEAHAQRGTEHVPSATRRFGESLLPMLQGRATDLVLELWLARGDCGSREQEVARRQQPVTAPQATGNQHEFVALGSRAKALGITPHALEPSCAEYDRILAGGEADIALMLEAIARSTAEQIKRLLGAPEPAARTRLVVAYGGALHNDTQPRPGRERWSFGPELIQATGGRYVELDLIVPEYIKDNETWRALPWYPHFDPSRHPERTTLFRPAPGSYVLIFPACGAGCSPPSP